MKEKILKAFEESIKVKEQFIKENVDAIIEVSKAIADTFNDGRKLILFGNGGSSTDASHIAAEFVNRFKKKGRAFRHLRLILIWQSLLLLQMIMIILMCLQSSLRRSEKKATLLLP